MDILDLGSGQRAGRTAGCPGRASARIRSGRFGSDVRLFAATAHALAGESRSGKMGRYPRSIEVCVEGRRSVLDEVSIVEL